MAVRLRPQKTLLPPSKISRLVFCLLPLVAATAVCSAQSAKPIPKIAKTGDQYRLLVDGNPYLMLGGQVHNSDTANADDLNKALDVLASWHANTAEVPIYWEAIEPKQGQFDFSSVDLAIQAARKRDLHLVFLWFGTWKNGDMDYTPEWLKRDPSTYKRVIGALGQEMWIISPLCNAARDADARAFRAVMEHIRSIDEQDRTVIMMQVENETGLIGTDRDYSEEATRVFAARSRRS